MRDVKYTQSVHTCRNPLYKVADVVVVVVVACKEE